MRSRLSESFLLERGNVACLLLHGFAGSPAEVRPLGEYLASQGITVRAPLLPGHGTSPEDLRRTRWPDWVRAAKEEVADLTARYGGVHLAGFSMGGLVALHLASHQPVVSLTTLSCPSKLADWRQILVPLAQFFVPYYPARISNPAVASQLESYDRFPVAAIHSLLRLAKRVRRELPRVTSPLLVAQGDKDRWIVPESAEYILQHAGSRVKESVMLPGRNHMITLEHGREELFQLIGEWIRRHAQAELVADL